MPRLFEIRIPFKEENNVLVYNSLYLNDISNILEEEKELVFYLEEDKLSVLDEIKKYLKENNFSGINKIKQSEFTKTNWDYKWKKSIKPVIIKDKIVIYPSWKFNDVQKYKDKLFIQIDPKMSFGTGHNETTQMILEMLCSHIAPSDKYMLDYGCGTGILAIAAVKLGMHKAVAIDIDEVAFENAEENIRINNLESKIKLLVSDIDDIKENDFDIICVNIVSNVIEEKINLITGKLKPQGKLFISGILTEESGKFLKFLGSNNLSVIETLEKAEWIGIYARK
jgi:ribosomal protein L11 methyltransferase